MRKQPQESPQNKPKPPIAAQDRAKLDLCMSTRQELLGRLEARDAEIDRLTEELDMYRNGYQGSCIACEPVAKENQRLREALEKITALSRNTGCWVNVDTEREAIATMLREAWSEIFLSRRIASDALSGQTLSPTDKRQGEVT